MVYNLSLQWNVIEELKGINSAICNNMDKPCKYVVVVAYESSVPSIKPLIY